MLPYCLFAGPPRARAVPGFLKSPAPYSHGAWVQFRNARAGHYCPIAHGLKMGVFIESEDIRWAKSSQQPCSNFCDIYSKEKEKDRRSFDPEAFGRE